MTYRWESINSIQTKEHEQKDENKRLAFRFHNLDSATSAPSQTIVSPTAFIIERVRGWFGYRPEENQRCEWRVAKMRWNVFWRYDIWHLTILAKKTFVGMSQTSIDVWFIFKYISYMFVLSSSVIRAKTEPIIATETASKISWRKYLSRPQITYKKSIKRRGCLADKPIKAVPAI